MQVLSYTSPIEWENIRRNLFFCVFWIIWRLQFVRPVRTSTWNWSHLRYPTSCELTQVDFFSHVSYELSQPPQELLLLLLVQLLLLRLLLLRTMWVGDTITLRKTESFTPLFGGSNGWGKRGQVTQNPSQFTVTTKQLLRLNRALGGWAPRTWIRG